MRAPDRLRTAERQRTSAGSGRFVRHADWALFVTGGVALAGALFMQQDTAVTMLLILVAAALLLAGALLPRLSGTIKVSPTGIELQVLQRLETTRAEAERVAPDHVAEALLRAYVELRPLLEYSEGLTGATDRGGAVDDGRRGPAPAAAVDRPAAREATEPEDAEPTDHAVLKCSQCGRRNEPGNSFCRGCGHHLRWDEDEPTPDPEHVLSEAPVDVTGGADTGAEPRPASAPPGLEAQTTPAAGEDVLRDPPRLFARRILAEIQYGDEAHHSGRDDHR